MTKEEIGDMMGTIEIRGGWIGMKKALVLVLAMLLCCVGAYAQPETFVFDNGVTWDSTLEEVRSVDPEYVDPDFGPAEPYYFEVTGLTELTVRVDNGQDYEEYVTYDFMGDQLVACALEYDLDWKNEGRVVGRPEFCKAAFAEMAAKYDLQPGGYDRLEKLCKIMNPDYMSGWGRDDHYTTYSTSLADGTFVWICWDSGYDFYYNLDIIYINEPALLAAANG